MSVLRKEMCVSILPGAGYALCVSYLKVVPEWFVCIRVYTHNHIVGHTYTNTYHSLGRTYIAPSMKCTHTYTHTYIHTYIHTVDVETLALYNFCCKILVLILCENFFCGPEYPRKFF